MINSIWELLCIIFLVVVITAAFMSAGGRKQ